MTESSMARVFENEQFGKVRCVSIDGDPWFVGKDVAEALGYSNTRKAVADHVEVEDMMGGVTIRDSMGRDQHPILINESGLYSLIMSSKLPAAKEFQHWVTREVIPDIRRHGQYITPEKRAEFANDPVAMLQQTIEYIQSKDKRIAELEAEKSKLETGNRELSRHAYYLEHRKDLFDFINKCVRSNAGIAHGGHMGFAWRAYFDALTPIIGRDLRKLDETPYIKQLKETEMVPAIKLAGRMAIRDVESLVGSEMMAIIRKTILG